MDTNQRKTLPCITIEDKQLWLFVCSWEFDDPKFRELVDAMNYFLQLVGSGIMADVFPVFKYIPTPGLRKVKKTLNIMLAVTGNFLKDHRETFDPGMRKTAETSHISSSQNEPTTCDITFMNSEPSQKIPKKLERVYKFVFEFVFIILKQNYVHRQDNPTDFANDCIVNFFRPPEGPDRHANCLSARRTKG